MVRKDVTTGPLPLTIVIASIQGWPAIRKNVKTFRAAAEAVGGELIVADGSGNPAPPQEEIGSHTVWLSEPGTSVFQLRRLAYRMARGAIVALTEDHCFVAEDWGRRILDAHAEHPEASVIGGAVENGATGSLIDWASFFVVQSAFMAPLVSGPASRLAGAVNVSYKQHALDALADHEGMGAMDVLHQAMLRERGEALWADDGIRVTHEQSLGVKATIVIHFHAGRTMSGFRRQHMTPYQWLRAAGAFVVPIGRMARILAFGARKRQLSRMLPSAPWALGLLYSQAAGQLIGYALGAGDSPRRVQ
jgi:hypothetical protein